MGFVTMSSGIVLTSAIRSNLLTLQNTTELQGKIQERLSTGKKVNSALDNPANFFTAAGLNRRASDLSSLLDGMANGIKTLEAADKGMKGITQTVETMRAYVRQARQDKSFKGMSYTLDTATIGTAAAKNLTFSGGAVGTTPINVGLQVGTSPVYTAGAAYAPLDMTTGDETYSFTVSKNGGAAVTVSLATADNTGGGTDISQAEAIAGINADLTAGSSTIRVRDSLTTPGRLEFYDTDAANLGLTASIDVSAVTTGGTTPTTTDPLGWTGNPAAATGTLTVRTVDQMVTAINGTAGLTDRVRATNDGGKLRIDNISTEPLTVVGATAAGAVDGSTGVASTQTVGGNEIRKNLIAQFNELRRQLDKLSDDASYNGVNLLKADKLKITFNEIGTSVLEIQAQDSNGVVRGINTTAASLDIPVADAAEFSDDALLDARLDALGDSITVLQTQSGSFGSSLSIVQIRQEFTKSMINTLEVGADGLTLADQNEEGANLLALNTRQQLSQTALSLAAQAQQAVLRLFG
jgi:flagellin